LKMNVFHWHLTDDQGWRLPIAKYPKLISVASNRDSSQTAVTEDTNGKKKFTYDGKPHSGYYSYQDIQEILQYAADRHITIIPEIDMPSHNQAAMAAYPWLSTTKKETRVPTVFFGEPYYQNPAEINIADPRVIQFFKDVLDETISLFPTEIIHIGGDEVWYDLWAESSDINTFMQENGFKSYADLQLWFSSQMSQYLAGKGKRMMAWNDVLGGHLEGGNAAHQVTVNIRPLKQTVIGFWKGDIHLINNAAKQGYDIVNGYNAFTYFNFDHSALSLAKAYDFDPIPIEITAENRDKIKGVACHLWTENVPDLTTLYYQLFPRIAASAEVGWTTKEQKNYDRFKMGLKNLQRHWDKVGIGYYKIIETE